jgi:hypothetical protein
MYRGEFDLTGNTAENPGLSPIDQALGKLEDHIQDAELNSPRFQAFADNADMFHALLTLNVPSAEESNWMKHSKGMMEMRAVIIAEDIRKKENSVVGYKKEMGGLEPLFDGLLAATGVGTKKSKQTDQQATMAIKRLVAIKEQAIERKSQQPPQSK